MQRPGTLRRAWIAGGCLASVTLAAVLLDRGSGAAQTAAPQPPPVFRRDATFVHVDVYPTRAAQAVTDLTRQEFEILEDGVPQTIREFQYISRPAITDARERRDPNTVADAFEQAADGRRRVFVVFLDTNMSTIEGSHRARKPVVSMLDQLVGPDDLYAIMTPDMRASAITFTRRTEGLDADLAKYWTWGERDAPLRRDPEEMLLETCFPDPAPARYCYGPDGKLVKQPENAYRGVAVQLIERRAETRTLDALDDLVHTLALVREGRKAVIVVSQGWRLLGPKPELTRLQECESAPRPPTPGVDPTGRLVPDTRNVRSDPRTSDAVCHQLAITYASVDNEQRFRDLIARANRFNVSFYPFDARGLAVFDRSIEARDQSIRNDPGERSPRLQGQQSQGPVAETSRLMTRVESLRTLAEATGGLAVANTNDLNAGAKRIVDDLAAYYLLGYQSTNSRLDGRWRAITVRVKRPGVDVRARQGYRALTEAEAAAISAAVAAGAGTPATPSGSETPGATSVAAAVSSVIRTLAALDRPVPWRSRAAWRLEAPEGGARPRVRFWIASEIDAVRGQPEWASGGNLSATLTLPDGAALGSVSARLEPGTTALEAAIDGDVPAGADVVVKLRLTPAGGGLPLTDTLRVTNPGQQPGARLSRSAPATGNRFVVAATPRFRRGERLRVATPLDAATATAEASLLDRAGSPMRVPATARVETIDGRPWAVGEVSLAPLSAGDYVLQLVVRVNDQPQRVLTAFRVVP